ncbi:MAG: glycosyltransferase family 9 protein [bacterium]|jgi:heptosyltransferase-2
MRAEKRPGPASGREFLVIRLSSFGDVVLTEPVTRAIKRHYPDSRVTFITNSDYAALPAMFSSVDEVMSYLREGDNETLDRLAEKTEFGLTLDLQNNVRSRRITRGLRTGKVLRHRRQRFLRFIRVHLPRLWRGDLKPVVRTYFDVLDPLGIPAGGLTPVIKPPASSVEEARRMIGRNLRIAVCPGGSSEHKRWSDARFDELVNTLLERGHLVLVIGSEQDRERVEAAAGGSAAKTYVGNDIALIAGLLSRCPVTVTNDSGLMHLAAAVGSKVAAIFGSTSPALGFGPTAPGSRLISLNLDCSPCSYHGNVACRLGTRRCFENIGAAMVADTVEDMLR